MNRQLNKEDKSEKQFMLRGGHYRRGRVKEL
jgi:hypothetical protein